MTAQQLKQIAPNCKNPSIYADLLTPLFDKYHINTKERQACFLGQVAEESISFNYTREQASGNAYEGRKDLGNIYPGDGPKFKGRGLIQITGRNNYKDCSRHLFGDDSLLKNPDLLATPKYAAESACWYWMSRGLNEVADQPDDWTHTTHDAQGNPKHTYKKFEWLTVLINGGLNGFNVRLEFYNRAKQVL